jgi:hypothetical protein
VSLTRVPRRAAVPYNSARRDRGGGEDVAKGKNMRKEKKKPKKAKA